jgi:chromosome segregation ATPase
MKSTKAGSMGENGMVRRICGLAVVGLLALAGLSSAETVRTTSRLNLRQEPTTSSPRIELLPAGLELEVISRRGLWIRVDKDGTEGWVHSDYVAPTAPDGAGGAQPGDPGRSARDAELARDVALLRVGKLERELEALRAGAPDAARQNVALKARVEELSAQLEERDARVAALVEEVAAADNSGSLSIGVVEGAESEQAALDAVELDRLAERVRELETELESASGAADRRTGEIAELQRQLAEGDSRAAVLEARDAELKALTAELTEAHAAIVGRDESLRELEDRLASATAATAALEQSAMGLESVTEERDALAAELARVAAVAETVGVEQGQLEARLAAIAEERDLLTRAASTRDGRISDLEESLRERDTELVNLRAAVERNRDSALENDDRVRELSADRDRIAAELASEKDALTTANEQLKARSDELARERSRSRAAAEASEGERGRLEASLAAVVEERDLLTRSAAARERRISELGETLREREVALASLRAALEENRGTALAEDARERELAADRDRLAAEVATHEAALTTAGERMQERDERIAALEAALAAGGAEGDEALRAARQALELANDEKDRLAKTAEEYETEGRRYAEALIELQDWSDRAEAEIARLGAANGELTATVADLKGKASRRQEPLRRELEETRAREKAAAERLADAERETSRLRDELAANGSIDSRLTVAETARTQVEEELRVARVELAAATVARQRSQAEALELADQLASAAARQAVLARRVTELEQARQAGYTDLERQVAELTEERDGLARSLSRGLSAAEATAGEVAIWRATADRRAAEADAARRQLAAANDQLEALRAERGTLAARVPVVAPAEPLAVAARSSEDPRALDGRGQGTSEPAPESPLVTVAEPIIAAVAAPEAAAPDPRAGAIAAVRSWAGAWSRQDVDGYLASYGASFQPPDGLGRGEWAERRRVRLRRPSFIAVEVSDVETRVLSPDRVAVRFRQDYRSNSYADRVLKTLELARVDGDWKIVREAAE